MGLPTVSADQHRLVVAAACAWRGAAAGRSLVTTALPATPTPWAQSLVVSWTDGSHEPVVVRLIDRTLSPADAIEAEMAAASEAGTAAVGPPVHFRDPDQGVLIMGWLESSDRGAGCAERVGAAVDLLARWHRCGTRVGVQLEGRKTAAALDRVDGATSSGRLPICFGWAADTYRRLKNSWSHDPAEAVLCHNDLNPTNMIFSGHRWWLIDFDHVGMADPLFDLATMLLGLRLGLPESSALLDRYLGRAAERNERDRLVFHRVQSLLRYAFSTSSLVPADRPHTLDSSFPDDGRAFALVRRVEEPIERAVGRLALGFLKAALDELRAPYVANAFRRLGLTVPDTIELRKGIR